MTINKISTIKELPNNSEIEMNRLFFEFFKILNVLLQRFNFTPISEIANVA